MQADLLAALGIGLGSLGVRPSVLPPAAVELPAWEHVESGTGPGAQQGDLVTIHFVVRTQEGKELANSMKRGMPYSIALGEEHAFWLSAVSGLQAGGKARLRANSSQFFGKSGALPIVPPETEIVAELTLIRIQKQAAKQGQR